MFDYKSASPNLYVSTFVPGQNANGFRFKVENYMLSSMYLSNTKSFTTSPRVYIESSPVDIRILGITYMSKYHKGLCKGPIRDCVKAMMMEKRFFYRP